MLERAPVPAKARAEAIIEVAVEEAVIGAERMGGPHPVMRLSTNTEIQGNFYSCIADCIRMAKQLLD